jgi:predicted nucleic acid-binding protein
MVKGGTTLMNYYFESSAVLKLLFQERESAELKSWVTAESIKNSGFLTSELTRLEVLGKAASTSAELLRTGQEVLAGMTIIRFKPAISDWAIEGMKLGLRTLDAIHFGTAKYLSADIQAFISFDQKLMEVCSKSGIRAISPGA